MAPVTPDDKVVYVGPRPFRTGERLFGRDREVAALTSLLIAERVVLLYSPSGAGKTSLIQAGLVPRLRPAPAADGPARKQARTRPFTVPAVGGATDVLAPAVIVRVHTPTAVPGANRYVLSALGSLETHRPPADRRPAGELAGRSLAAYLAEEFPTGEVAGDRFRPTVLVFDQFEEVLTQDPTDTPQKRALFEQLGAVLADRTRWVLIAIREDYLAALEPYLPLLPTRLDARYRLDRLAPEAAREAILGPARAASGVEFEAAAADRLVEDLRQVRVQQPDNTFVDKVGPYVEPVHLQVVCKSLWDMPDRAPDRITAADIERLGRGDGAGAADLVGVDRVLAAYYATHVEAAAAAGRVSERQVREWFDRELIATTESRKPVQRGEEARYGLNADVLAVLDRAYLVREESRSATWWWELAHDRLVRPVRAANAAWRLDRLHPLQRRADEWAAQGKHNDLLLRGSAQAQAERWAKLHAEELSPADEALLTASRDHRGRHGYRGVTLAEVGWGVIFAHEADPAVREALSELLDHRRKQAAEVQDGLYREFVGALCYRPDESAHDFLARHGVWSGSPNWSRVPYFLLLVGDPAAIPFDFQYGLAGAHAVGRVHFDTLEEYASYARSVVTAEGLPLELPRRAVLFGPRHPDDTATELGDDLLLQPLLQEFQGKPQADSAASPFLSRPREDQARWTVEAVRGEDATKARLRTLIGESPTPTFLFTLGHSPTFSKDDPRRPADYGALLCQEWPGPGSGWASPPREWYLSAADIGDDARLLGLVAFLCTSGSAGCPEFDDFPKSLDEPVRRLAPQPFVARLPQRLLGHPAGGALAVVGHVGEAWTASFTSVDYKESDVTAFVGTFNRLFGGYTVGEAMRLFSQRYIHGASELARVLEEVVFFKTPPDDWKLLELRKFAVDARNWVILGDPAVRLPVGEGRETADRPAIEPVPARAAPRTVGPSTPTEPRPTPTPSPAGRLVVANGIDGESGEYLLPPMTPNEFYALVRRQLKITVSF